MRKRLLAILLTLCMLLSMLPATALAHDADAIPVQDAWNIAEPPLRFTEEVEIARPRRLLKASGNEPSIPTLSEPEGTSELKMLLDISAMIRQALLDGTTQINLDLPITADSSRQFYLLGYACPYLDTKTEVALYHYTGTKKYACVQLDNSRTPEETAAWIAEIDAALEKLNALVDDACTPVDMALIWHDYMCANYHYDQTYTNYYPSEMLLTETGVCQAYAYLFQYLMNSRGQECYMVVSNEAMNHGWNMLKLGDNYYHIDITWDDPTNDLFGMARHTYFLLSDATISDAAHRHTGWREEDHALPFDCTDASYENAYYSNAMSPIVHDGTARYYIAEYGLISGSAYLLQYDTEKQDVTDIDSLAYWPAKPSGYHAGAFSGLSERGGKLYYNTYNEIRTYDLKEKKVEAFCTLDTAEGNAFGSVIKGDTLFWDCAEAPSVAYASKNIKQIELPCLHSYAPVVTPPTCTEPGYTTYTCAKCGDSYTADELPASGHNMIGGACTNCSLRTVTIASGLANGIVRADKAAAYVGETVALTVIPAEGYGLDSLSVTYAGGAVEITDGNTFVMPDGPVTVTASFKAIVNYLCFTALSGSPTVAVTIKQHDETYAPELSYSFDMKNWIALDWTEDCTIPLYAGQTVYFMGDNAAGLNTYDDYITFDSTGTGTLAVSGDITTLLDPDSDGNEIPSDCCFYKLFYSNDNLVDASGLLLPADILKYGCYYYMFGSCEALTKAPYLPATQLAEYCYNFMYHFCTSLTAAPALPALTMKRGCYNCMYEGCKALKVAPTLPATTLAEGCYNCMFEGCMALEVAPTLPATTLAERCYSKMFSSCASLTYAPTLPATTLAERCYSEMFLSCTSLKEAPALPATKMAPYCYEGMFKYCYGAMTQAPVLPATMLAEGCYRAMFYCCKTLKQAPELPATVLAAHCYDTMFYSCDALTKAPALPATTLAPYCYYDMFWDCNYLTEAPALPATKMAESCYGGMFSSCASLTQAPALPATTLAPYCYFAMFLDTALRKAPALPATKLAYGCYYTMFMDCTKLTEAPVLPATKLVEECYGGMFYGCKSLSRLEVAFTAWLPDSDPTLATDTDATGIWLMDVAPTGTIICPDTLNDAARGESTIPAGWSIVNPLKRVRFEVVNRVTTLAYSESMTFPGVARAGYTFTGWELCGASYATDAALQTALDRYAGRSEVTVTALYEQSSSFYSVTIHANGTTDTKSYREGDSITVTAPKVAGKYFVEWRLGSENGYVVGAKEGYYFQVKQDVDLYAIYADEKPVVPDATLTISGKREAKNGKNYIVYTATSGVRSDVKVVAMGIEYRTTPNGAYTRKQSTLTCENIVYNLNLNITGNENRQVYARGYLTYKTSNGTTKTVYTAEVSASYNDLATSTPFATI